MVVEASHHNVTPFTPPLRRVASVFLTMSSIFEKSIPLAEETRHRNVKQLEKISLALIKVQESEFHTVGQSYDNP